MKESISVVIPAFNEEKTVEDVVKVAIFVLKRLKIDYEIVLVNDGSTDQTGVIINRLAKENKYIQVIHHPQNRGFSGAMKTCFKNAKKEYIFLGPADGQFDFKELPKFVKAIKGYDVAMGYRIKFNESLKTKLKIAFFHLPFLFLCRILLGIRIREFSVSLWRKKVYQSINVQTEDRSAMFLPELISKALKRKYKFIEVPINLHMRRGGKSKGTSFKVALKTFLAMINFWFKQKFKYKLIWVLVCTSILISVIGARYELSGLDLRHHPYLGILLSPFDNIRYGHYIARKFFLVMIAFIVFFYWLKTQQKNLLVLLRNNIKYLAIIAVVLFLSRILTFNFWFYNDDARFFDYQLYGPTQQNYNLQGHWGAYGANPIAIFLVVIRWFETNYTLYNFLGLFFYFLAGAMIFILGNKIQKSKFVSLAAALFFITTPTNFQGRLLIGEIVNSPFAILLILLSIYMLLQKFISGALIFAAAALEYGVAKTYIMAVPLTLFTIFFAFPSYAKSRVINLKKSLLFLIITVFAISLVYINSFAGNVPKSRLLDVGIFDKLVIFGDVLLAVTIPLCLAQPLVKVLNTLLHGWIYLTAALGFLVVAGFALLGIVVFLKGKVTAAKLITIGLAIIIPTAAVGSTMGVRVDHNVSKLVEYVINSPIPTGATGYGVLPALGLVLILIGIGCFLKRRTFIIIAVSLLLINIVSSFWYDYRWMISPYSYPQRRYNEQLQKILHRDGIKKYIFVTGSQRPLYQGVTTFAMIFQGDQSYYQEMDPETFVATLKKDKPPADHIYFFVTSGNPNYNIYDYSSKIRNVPLDKLTPRLKSLIKQLVPERTEFFVL